MTSTDPTPQPAADAAYVVIPPTGALTWLGADAQEAVEEMVAGPYPHAVTRIWLGPGCPLKVVASDLFAVYPQEFPPNAVAEGIIRGLSGGYVEQAWRGTVAVYAHEDGFAEVMPREWVERITELTAGDEAMVGRGKGSGRPRKP